MDNTNINNRNQSIPLSNVNSTIPTQYTAIFDPSRSIPLGQHNIGSFPQHLPHSQPEPAFLPLQYPNRMLPADSVDLAGNQNNLLMNNPMMLATGQNQLSNQMVQGVPPISSSNSTPSVSRHNSVQLDPNANTSANKEDSASIQIPPQLSGLVGSISGPNKNWPYKILGELRDFLHVLSPSGRFLFCSPSCLEITGYATNELVGQNITNFIHVDDVDSFIRDFNLSVHSKSLNLFYRFRKKDDKFAVFEVNGHPYFADQTNTPKCFFMMARPYPSKAISLLDSFLELKLENELLTKKLERYKRFYDGNENDSGDKTISASSKSNEENFDPNPQLKALVGESTPSSSQTPRKRVNIRQNNYFNN
jgi:PAS domain S-box-containing protein